MRTALAIASALAAVHAVPASAADVVVRLAPGADRPAVVADAGGDGSRGIGLARTVRVALAPGTTPREALTALRGRDDVVWAEPEITYRAARVPDDPLFSRQWGLANAGGTVGSLAAVPGVDVGAPAAWDVTTGDRSVAVGIVDTGISPGHPDLAPNIDPADTGRDFVDGDADPTDLDGHGTLVAGILGGRGGDGSGIAGVTWSSRLVALRALDATGAGSSADVAQAFAEAGRRGLRVVNASLGASSASSAISDAVTASPDTLFVVAAGNGGRDVDVQPEYPCALPQPNVICVASIDAAGNLAASSNRGRTSVDLGAPGVDVLGPAPAYGQVAFADDFETPLDGRWTVSGGATWGLTTAEGSTVLSDSPGGDYTPGTSMTIRRTTAVSLAGRSGCRLAMRLRLDTRSGASLVAEVSPSGGGPWTAVGSYSGSSGGGFVPVSASLHEFDGTASLGVRLRFTAGSGSVPAGGADVDDLAVSCLGGPYGAEDFVTESGTSFAAPHVAGIAALVAARHPGFTVAQVRQAVLEGVVPLPSLAGRTATGGRADALGALRAADRIAAAPAGGAAPVPVTPSAPGAGPAQASAPARLRPAVLRRGGLWTVDLALPRTALTEITFARRTRVRPARFRLVRDFGPTDVRAGVLRYRLGRLGPGVYRVTVRLQEERRVLRRTLRVVAARRR